MLRRFRGVLVMAALWAFTWGVVGVLIGLFKWYRGDLIDVLPTPMSVAISVILSIGKWFGVVGAINGLLFALVLAIAERKQSVATLSLTRFALWGGVATLVVPLFTTLIFLYVFGPSDFGISITPLAEFMALGMVSATAILLIARRGKAGIVDPAA